MFFSFPVKCLFRSRTVFSSKLVEKEALEGFWVQKILQTLPNTHSLQSLGCHDCFSVPVFSCSSYYRLLPVLYPLPTICQPLQSHFTSNILWITYSSVVYGGGSNTSIWRNGVGRNELCVTTTFKTHVCVLCQCTNTSTHTPPIKNETVRHSLASTG